MQCDNQRHGQPGGDGADQQRGQSFICFTVKATIPRQVGCGKQVEISVSMTRRNRCHLVCRGYKGGNAGYAYFP